MNVAAHPWITAAAAVIVVAALGAAAFALVGAQPKQGTQHDAQIEKAIRTAILTDMRTVIVPAGSSAGHVSDQAVQELKDRLAAELPKVYGGDLLTEKEQALNSYVDALGTDETLAQNTDAGITELTMEPTVLEGTHATVRGSCSVWVSGRHLEDGQLKDDRVEATYTFTAGLDQTQGTWLVTSWSDVPGAR